MEFGRQYDLLPERSRWPRLPGTTCRTADNPDRHLRPLSLQEANGCLELGQRPKLSFQLKIVPFEDTSTSAAFSNIGKKYDLMIGPHNSVNIAKISGFLELGQARFCLAMPRSHPLSGKKSVSYRDLHGERFFMQAKGNSPVNDKIRAAIEQGHPEITIVDLPHHYDLEVFNRCAEEGGVLLNLDIWNDVHPSLVTVPFQVKDTIPYGILFPAKPAPEIRQFLDIVRSLVYFN